LIAQPEHPRSANAVQYTPDEFAPDAQSRHCHSYVDHEHNTAAVHQSRSGPRDSPR